MLRSNSILPDMDEYDSDQYGIEMNDIPLDNEYPGLNDSVESPKFVNEPLLTDENGPVNTKPNQAAVKRHRPSRILIDVINNLPTHIVARISPQSVQTKKWIKTAMVLYILSSSMFSGMMAMLIKLAGRIVFQYDIYEALK